MSKPKVMAMKKLLIADSEEDFRLALEETLEGKYQIRTCENGMQAKDLILTFHPDIIVLDMMMPELDGISILIKTVKADLHPMVLSTSRYYNEYSLEQMYAMSVEFAIQKPCDLMAVVERICDLSLHLTPPGSVADQQAITAGFLKHLGIGSHLDGYRFLKVGIPLYAKNENQRLSKELYVTIAEMTGFDTAEQVERSIRKAIEGAWMHRDETLWRDFFKPDKNGSIPKPKNRTFIASLADRLNKELFKRL